MRASAFLCLAVALLWGCSRSTPGRDEPTPRPASIQSGIEAALRSENPGLISGTILEILGAENQPAIDIKESVDRIRERQDGRERIDRAIKLLRQHYAARSGELDAVEVLAALAALDGDAREKSLYFAIFESRLEQPSNVAGSSFALVEAALLFDPKGTHLPDWLARSHSSWHSFLLLAAKDRKASVPVEALEKVLRPARAALERIETQSEAPLGENVEEPWKIAGIALLLIREAQGTAAPSPTATDSVAQADAALDLRDGSLAVGHLRQAATSNLGTRTLNRWLEVAGNLVAAFPETRGPVLDLAARYMWPEVTPDSLAPLLRLDSRTHAGAALRLLRQTTAETLKPSLTGAAALNRSTSAGAILEALCASPAGRAPLVDDDIYDSGGGERTPGPPLSQWSDFVQELPQGEAKAFLRTALAADPATLGTHCPAALVIAQNRVKADAGMMTEPMLRGTGSLLQLVSEEAAAWLARPDSGDEARKREIICAKLERKIGESLHLASSRQDVIDYVTVCPGDRDITDTTLINSSASSELTAYALGITVWDGQTPSLVHFNPLELPFPTLVSRDYSLSDLDYGTLVMPLLTGRAAAAKGTPAGGRSDLSTDNILGASRALMVADGDADMATWLAARVTDYKQPRPAAANGDAMAATLAVLNRAWHDTEEAVQRRMQLETRVGLDDKESKAEAEEYRSSIHQRIADEVTAALEQLCASGPRPREAGLAGPLGRFFEAAPTCIGEGRDDARALSAAFRARGLSSAGLDSQLAREAQGGILSNLLLLLLAHAAVWALLLIVYPRSPAIQASVFWNPWVRKYLGFGYVQFVLLVVPPFTRRLLEPFRDGLTADGRLDEFRPEIYFGDIQGERQGPSGRVVDRIAALIPSVDTKIWLQARSGSGKSWFLRKLANRTHRPVIFLNATSCVEGITAALKARTAGWVAESDFLEQLIHSGRIVVIIDGLNEVAADIRSDIVLFANRFARGRILIATQPVGTARPMRADRIDVLPLARDQIETFLAGRAAEVLRPQDDAAVFSQRVRRFVDSLEEGSEEERRALLEFVSNPMDLRLVADLLAAGATPDLLNLQEQQIRLVEDDYEAANGAAFPIVAFAEFLYALRRDNKPLVLGASDWPAERVALHDRRLVLRDDAPGGGERWRFRHDKITDYFLYRAFQTDPDRQTEHLADNRFIGAYVLMARKMPREQARKVLTELYWAGGRTDDFTIGKVFQETLEQKLALQKASQPARNLSPPME